MPLQWSVDQVLGLAPDDGSARAGQGLARASKWKELGQADTAVWGAIQGSGKDPYRVRIDLIEPAFKCSCPSRKFPCKHGLGLLLILAEHAEAIPKGEPPDWVAEWLAQRAKRQETKAAKAAEPREVDAEAQAKRVAKRQARVEDGVDELSLWLQDLVRQGLGTAQAQPVSYWESMAARLVDAQAPGLARHVRSLGQLVSSGEGWQDRSLAAVGRMHLLCEAHRRIGELPEDVQPEFVIELISAGRWGNTVEAAASAFAGDRARTADNLKTLVELLDDALLADLPDAVGSLITAIQQHAALGSDVPQLMDALPPLARIGRYGNVRQTDVTIVLTVVDGLLTRICVGIFAAASSFDDDAARQMFGRINGVHDAIGLLQNNAQRDQWLGALSKLADQAGLSALVAGRAVRLLHDAAFWPHEEVGRRLSLALSTGNDPSHAAGWIEGFLSGSGALLIHDEPMWLLVDNWLSELGTDHFAAVLPLLRRTFATFHAPERRQLGERVMRGGRGASAGTAGSGDFDYELADAVLPLLAKILGVENPAVRSPQ